MAVRRAAHPTALLGAWLLAAIATVSIVLPMRLAAFWHALPLMIAALIWVPFAASVAVGPLLFAFFAVFPRRTWSPVRLAVAMFPGVILLAWHVFGGYQVMSPPGAATTVPDSLPVVLVINIAYAAGAIAMLRAHGRAAQTPTERRRIRVLMMGTIIGVTSGAGAVIGYWLQAGTDIFATRTLAALSLVFLAMPASFAYAILRHRLFDLRLIVRQGVRYALARRMLDAHSRARGAAARGPPAAAPARAAAGDPPGALVVVHAGRGCARPRALAPGAMAESARRPLFFASATTRSACYATSRNRSAARPASTRQLPAAERELLVRRGIELLVPITSQTSGKIPAALIALGPRRSEERRVLCLGSALAWNGDLVVYAHGIVDPVMPVALPSSQDNFTAVRDALMARGFAVASSSFSENGFALKDATQRTHQLSALFTAQFGRPRRVLLAGHSLGSMAALELAETYPDQYDGALVMCGFTGGTVREIEYMANARIAFDYFFPGVIPGSVFDIPPGTDYRPGTPLFNQVQAALVGGFAPPQFKTIQFASVAKLPWATPQELVAAALSVIGFNLRYTQSVLDHTHGHIPFDNREVGYTGTGSAAGDEALDAGIQRWTGDLDAMNYVATYYTPTGALHVPVQTLHSTRDPVVPASHEDKYRDTLSDQGAAGLLEQGTVAAFGHCAFGVQDVLTAFDRLVDRLP